MKPNIFTIFALLCFWIQLIHAKSTKRPVSDAIPGLTLNNFHPDFDKEKVQELTTQGPGQSFVCQPQITVNTPPLPPLRNGCNCSTTREIIAHEVQRIVNSCNAADNLEPSKGGSTSTNSQLQLLHQAVADLTTVLKAFQNPAVPAPATALPKDCSEVLTRGGADSGVYTVQPTDGGRSFQVYCDQETDGGGWTVFQRRTDGSTDFFRTFASYRRGFGELENEFWLGNDHLYRLTVQDEYELRIDLEDFDENTAHAVYSLFSVGNIDNNYELTIGEYSGNAGDALASNNHQEFTTKDRDNDNWASKNCAKEYHGAWWHNSCYYASLNGDYLGGMTEIYGKGILWYQWKGYYYSLKRSEMKFRMVDG